MARTAKQHGVAAAALAVLVLAVAVHPSSQQGASIQLPCDSNADCDTQGAVCEAGACACPRGQVMTSDLTRCLAGAGEWGAACSDAVQCVSRLLVGGSCAAQEVIKSVYPKQGGDEPGNACQCAQGYHYQLGQCWRSAGLGEACSRDENCYANHDGESVRCAAGKCECAAGFYQREYSSCRRVSTAYGQECGIVQDCQYADSACPNRKCRCRAGYKYDKDAAKCVAKPAATTVSSVRALRHSHNHHHDEDEDEGAGVSAVAWQALFGSDRAAPARGAEAAVEAADKVRADAACSTAADCGANSDCESGACVCQRGYFRLDGEAACHPEVLQVCSQDADCTMKNAVCRAVGDRHLCSCKGGYVASKDMRICRKMSRALDWSCLHDEQCGYFGPGAACVDKRCKCSTGTHWVEEQQYCWVSRVVGQTCEATEDCAALGSGAECGWQAADGDVAGDGGVATCRCGDGYHAAADGASCRVNADGVGAACQEDEDCVTAHTACRGGACACVKAFMADPADAKSCAPGVGGPCTADSQCAAGNSVCTASACSCPAGRVSAKAGDNCLSEVTALNGTCAEAAQCGPLQAACLGGACRCADDQHFRGGQCHPRRGLGDRCAATTECYLAEDAERAECRNGVCKCGFAFTNVGGLECSSSAARSSVVAVLLVAFLSLASTWAA